MRSAKHQEAKIDQRLHVFYSHFGSKLVQRFSPDDQSLAVTAFGRLPSRLLHQLIRGNKASSAPCPDHPHLSPATEGETETDLNKWSHGGHIRF